MSREKAISMSVYNCLKDTTQCKINGEHSAPTHVVTCVMQAHIQYGKCSMQAPNMCMLTLEIH